MCGCGYVKIISTGLAKKMNIKEIVINGIKVGFITKAVNGISTFLIMYFINKHHGTGYYGSIMIITSTSLLISSLSNPGVKFACLRQVSISNQKKIKSFWALWGLLFSLLISFLVSIIFSLAYEIIDGGDSNIKFGILAAPIIVAVNYNNYISRSYDLINYTLINISLPVSMILVYFLIIYKTNAPPHILALNSYLLGLIFQLLSIFYVEKEYFKRLNKKVFGHFKKSFILKNKIIFKKSLQYALGDSINILAKNIFVVTASFIGIKQEDIGLYSIAHKISALIMTLSLQIKTFLMPGMSILTEKSKKHEINNYGLVISKISTVITITSYIFSILVLKMFFAEINLALSSVPILMIIISVIHLGYLVEAWAGPVGMVIRLSGGESFQNIIMGISLLVSVLILLLLTKFGPIALALVSSMYLIMKTLPVLVWLKNYKDILFCWGFGSKR